MGFERSAIDGERSNRTIALAAEFGRLITAGDLLSGEALPTEKEIQTTHGVSRTVVREAVRHLAAKGLVSVGPKVGTKVRPRIDWNMLDADVMAWHLTAPMRRPFVEALYEMRLINEPSAARLAAKRIDAAQAERLTLALKGMRDNPRGSHELIVADLDFHRIILEATGNPILVSLGALIERSLSISFSLSWRQNPQDETVRQHDRVMQAILSGDGDAAELFMRRLIESAFNDVTHALYAHGEEGAKTAVGVGG
ncbi:FadR family transcriptional regulator [Jiella sp. MQZ9-1]|uniref:FadR family transcriptional regulator n=1 Tax=Jiella flava TaxID=2816857 RepID=A0A939FUL3_9HYPH|nr:FadR/GntR family transcriptional regulator [Jiella flava]MBO0661081.1 FadR family transcriptional regulator [Jiella flava]MCD2469728.1 FadR family transcriptional regulator [Jiella flava]